MINRALLPSYCRKLYATVIAREEGRRPDGTGHALLRAIEELDESLRNRDGVRRGHVVPYAIQGDEFRAGHLRDKNRV